MSRRRDATASLLFRKERTLSRPLYSILHLSTCASPTKHRRQSIHGYVLKSNFMAVLTLPYESQLVGAFLRGLGYYVGSNRFPHPIRANLFQQGSLNAPFGDLLVGSACFVMIELVAPRYGVSYIALVPLIAESIPEKYRELILVRMMPTTECH